MGYVTGRSACCAEIGRTALRTFGPETATRRLISTYFDAPQSDIAQAGYVLCVRREGAPRTQTIRRRGARQAVCPVRVGAQAGRRLAGDWRILRPVGNCSWGEALERVRTTFVTDIRCIAFPVGYADAVIDEGAIRCGSGRHYQSSGLQFFRTGAKRTERGWRPDCFMGGIASGRWRVRHGLADWPLSERRRSFHRFCEGRTKLPVKKSSSAARATSRASLRYAVVSYLQNWL